MYLYLIVGCTWNDICYLLDIKLVFFYWDYRIFKPETFLLPACNIVTVWSQPFGFFSYSHLNKCLFYLCDSVWQMKTHTLHILLVALCNSFKIQQQWKMVSNHLKWLQSAQIITIRWLCNHSDGPSSWLGCTVLGKILYLCGRSLSFQNFLHTPSHLHFFFALAKVL